MNLIKCKANTKYTHLVQARASLEPSNLKSAHLIKLLPHLFNALVPQRTQYAAQHLLHSPTKQRVEDLFEFALITISMHHPKSRLNDDRHSKEIVERTRVVLVV